MKAPTAAACRGQRARARALVALLVSAALLASAALLSSAVPSASAQTPAGGEPSSGAGRATRDAADADGADDAADAGAADDEPDRDAADEEAGNTADASSAGDRAGAEPPSARGAADTDTVAARQADRGAAAPPSTEGGSAVESSGGRDEEAPLRSRRPMPEYGHPPWTDEPLERLLWIPRIAFFPVYLVMEVGVRRPLGLAFRWVELEGLDTAAAAPTDAGWSWGLRPHVRYDHALVPSIGLAVQARDASDTLRLEAGVQSWGLDRLGGWGKLRATPRGAVIALTLEGGHFAERIQHGLGWDAPAAPRARYQHHRGEGHLRVLRPLWRGTHLGVGARLSVERFDAMSSNAATPAEGDALLQAAPGFGRGYSPLTVYARAVLDTRPVGQRFASGVRVELSGGWGVDVERGPPRSWARLSTSAEASIEVLRDRTLSVRGLADLVEPIGPEAAPFTEQVWLGGPLDRLAGFLPGRLVGASGASLGLVWRYNVWPWLDAQVFADVGNVFGRGFSDFDAERLRLSMGAALTAERASDFTLLVAFGTDPFVQGAGVSSARVAVGVGNASWN